jgi:Protein of unknown function (DUF3179)
MKKHRITVASFLAGSVLAGFAAAQEAPAALPYVAVHDPQFISAAEATFMSPDDRVIGLMDGSTAKAYPAAILSQHGLVEDRSPSGPIAVTW